MSADGTAQKPTRLDIPKPPRNRSKLVLLLVGVVATVAGAVVFVEKNDWSVRSFAATEVPLDLVEVDRGEIVASVVETGTVESANNTTVRCEVEALLGKVGGTTQATGGGSRPGGTGGAGGGQSAGGAASGGGSAKASTKGGTGGTGSRSAGTSSSGGSASGGSTASGGSATATTGKPTIRSFAYQVVRHNPMRMGTAKSASTAASQGSGQSMGGGGRSGGGGGGGGGRGMSGGGGGGRRGGGGGGGGQEEKPGSTRIVSILPEGSHVKKGDVVCELDSSLFRDELQLQQIRHVQAQAYVDQVQSILDVNEITYREYRDGVLPQDKQLIRQYIVTCQIQQEQAQKTVIWSREVTKKGFRAQPQLTADELSLQKTTIALREAEGMLIRLEKFTAPRILKSLEANLKAIRADKLAQQVAFGLEEKRLKDLERNIARCELKAPHEGIVVYANQTNPFGRQTDRIEEGVAVREGQPIFSLPDPLHMRIKAKINETKVNLIRTGQKATISVDAYPGRQLSGVVAEVNPISVPGGMISDVRIYYANINILEGFDNLRPGLGVEVVLYPETRSGVTRVPLDTVRWRRTQSFVALHNPSAKSRTEPRWTWRRVQLGLSDVDHVEVIDGVKAGDRVLANPDTLPEPNFVDENDAKSEGVATALLTNPKTD